MRENDVDYVYIAAPISLLQQPQASCIISRDNIDDFFKIFKMIIEKCLKEIFILNYLFNISNLNFDKMCRIKSKTREVHNFWCWQFRGPNIAIMSPSIKTWITTHPSIYLALAKANWIQERTLRN